MPASSPQVLAYRSLPRGDRRRSGAVAGVLLTLPAAVTPFLPFAYGIYPAGVARRWRQVMDGDPLMMGVILLSLGFALGPLVSLWRLRGLVSMPRMTESSLAWMAVVVAAVAAVAAPVLIARSSESWPPATVVTAVVAVVLSAAAVSSGVQRGAGVVRATAGAMSGVYVANALTALIGFRGSPEVGYWVTVLATVLAAIELVALSVAGPAPPLDPGA